MSKSEQLEPYINGPEVCRWLGISPRQLGRFLREKALPYHVVGEQRKFLASEVRAWLRTNKEKR